MEKWLNMLSITLLLTTLICLALSNPHPRPLKPSPIHPKMPVITPHDAPHPWTLEREVDLC